MTEPTVLVQISCTDRVRYSQTVTMPASAFAEYEAAVAREEKDRWFSDFAERWLDPTDIFDTEGFEDVEASISAPTPAAT